MLFDFDDGTFGYWLDIFSEDEIMFSSKAKLNNKDGILSITNKRFAFVPTDRNPLVKCISYDDLNENGKILVSDFDINIILNDVKYNFTVDPVYNWKKIITCIMDNYSHKSIKQLKSLIDTIDKNY